MSAAPIVPSRSGSRTSVGAAAWPAAAVMASLREELFELSAAERLELVEELWDSIADEDEALALTEEQREDLERRLAEADADPTDGSPWEEVRERIRQRSR